MVVTEIPEGWPQYVVVPRHPVIDKVSGGVTGYLHGKVWVGEEFEWRGDLHKAPLHARAVSDADQRELERARAEFVEQRQTKRASVAARKAAAAYITAGVSPVLPARPAASPKPYKRKGWPKGKPRGSRKAKPAPEPATSGVDAS
jgi:hypothetical protein